MTIDRFDKSISKFDKAMSNRRVKIAQGRTGEAARASVGEFIVAVTVAGASAYTDIDNLKIVIRSRRGMCWVKSEGHYLAEPFGNPPTVSTRAEARNLLIVGMAQGLRRCVDPHCPDCS